MHTRYLPAAVVAAVFGASAHTHAAFPFDDILFWVGEGTNQAAVVIDWGRNDKSAVRVWGYRWNGDATAADALLAIDEADTNLTMSATSSQGYGLSPQSFTYQAETETYEAGSEDFYGETDATGTYWSLSSTEAGGEMQYASVGASSLALAPDGRLGLKWTYYYYTYDGSVFESGDATVAETSAIAAPAPPFTFADIHYWVGEGTNRAALVVDFTREGYAPRAWGFRWNGEMNLSKLVAAIAHDDSRLGFYADPNSADTFATAFSYDVADVAATFDLASGTTTDPEAWFAVPRSTTEGSVMRGEFWNIVKGSDAAYTEVAAWMDTAGMDSEILANGTWYLFRINWYMFDMGTGDFEQGNPEAQRPLPAQSPYGWRVVAADVKAVGMYGNPTNALGHPSLSVPEWKQQNVPPTPATPAAPPWGVGTIVSLETASGDDVGGSITLEFDHPILDDPRNPFGLDFIVFGNTLHQIASSGGNGVVGNADPSTIVFHTAGGDPDPGLVEVAQDGETWFSFTNGPYADSFAPTLSHLYDPANANTNLFTGNLWWGATTDATRPVDPAVSFANFQGKSLAEYATLYDGSAGGTGFDISNLDLPADAQGHKWFRFLRVTTINPAATTEIDAVADVSPAPSFRNWVDAHVAFTDRPGYATTNLCANGAPAFVNAALGLAPDEPAPGAWAIEGFDGDTRTLTAPFAPFASDLVFLRASTNLADSAWSASLPLWTGTNAVGHPLLRAQTPAGSAEFFRLEVHE